MKQPTPCNQLDLLPLMVDANLLHHLHPESRAELTGLLKLLLQECVTEVDEENNEGGDQ